MSFRQSQSWLSTAKRRAKEGFLQAMGGHVTSEDQEFEVKYRSFLTNINEIQKIEQLMELWIESFDAFCLSTNVLAEAFSTFHNHSPYPTGEGHASSPYSNVSNEFNKVMSTIQRQLQPLIHETFTNRCLKPVVSILALAPELNDQMQQRKAHLADFESYRVKIQKEHAAGRDSSHPNVQKKAAKLDESAKRLHELQTSIFSTFQEFENARSQTLGPELVSFIACCHTFSAGIHNSTSRLLPIIPQSVTTLAALDYSTVSAELRLDRIDSTNLKLSLEKKVVNPILERTESMGGKQGGYGVTNITPANDSDSVNKGRKVISIPNSSGSRISSIKFKEPIHEENEESQADNIAEEASQFRESDLTNSIKLKDRALPQPPGKPPKIRSSEDYRSNTTSETIEPLSPSFGDKKTLSSTESKQPPIPPPKPPRVRKVQTDGESGNHFVEAVPSVESPNSPKIQHFQTPT